MNPGNPTSPPGSPPPRKKILFLSFVYPALGGTGTQLRSRALVRMLAAHADVFLLIVGHVEKVAGPRDPLLERHCQKIAYLRVLPSDPGVWPRSNSKAQPLDLPTIDCPPASAPDEVVRFYREHDLESLFVFRFESLFFIYQRLDLFPQRDLDLDELGSRRMARIDDLHRNFQPPALSPREKSFQAAAVIMEKVFLRRFRRVYVSSAAEAAEVSRCTGFAGCQVLPNSYPAPAVPPPHSGAGRGEIFFVGSLSYFPNADAVLYFCREILPLLRQVRGESVMFRVAGLGRAENLECVRHLPGVELAGYQEDLAPFYERAEVVAVPLRAGAGTRFKILEAFAHRRPVVSTSIGAEGLAVIHREHLLLADDPAAFAAACLEIITHPERFHAMCDAAAALGRALYSEEALARSYAEILAAEAPPAL